ncbi:alpha/beta fold hydrolase [Bradyrhizobium yuanmingense]|uniref:alpha/beta fold hydrolase n=1 Tax=Bradyrhizobium yuanmingense TaxID=108015 RepID=UPI0012F85F68|nr:alpha/beta fold hydrolase [Bradyrhizobium yuanmingense]
MPLATLAYVTLGRLNSTRSNVILMTHGYSSSHHYIEPDSKAAEGSWSALVGPNRAFDTDRFFIVSCNALGSCYGSTGPASIDPDTGNAWGERFPEVRLEDTVRLQRALLASWGVDRLYAVAGPSMGGFQALQWAVQYPDIVERIVVAVSGLRYDDDRAGREALAARVRALPAASDGRLEAGPKMSFLVEWRVETLRRYGVSEYLRDRGLAGEQCERVLREMARGWAADFEPWSLVALRDATAGWDATERLSAIRARVLVALSNTDLFFPAASLPAVLQVLKQHGVDAVGCEIRSRYGHCASGLDWQLWEAPLRHFIG